MPAIIAKLFGSGPKIVVGILIALVVWFACQSWRLSSANAVLQGKLTTETVRANKAEIDLAEAQRTIIRGDAAATAAQVRTRELEAATATAKESIDASVRQHGTAPVSPVTRDLLRRVRHDQR